MSNTYSSINGNKNPTFANRRGERTERLHINGLNKCFITPKTFLLLQELDRKARTPSASYVGSIILDQLAHEGRLEDIYKAYKARMRDGRE